MSRIPIRNKKPPVLIEGREPVFDKKGKYIGQVSIASEFGFRSDILRYLETYCSVPTYRLAEAYQWIRNGEKPRNDEPLIDFFKRRAEDWMRHSDA